MKSLCLAVAAALFCTFLTACAKTLPVDHVTGPETYEQELDIWANGFKRSYLVHVPPGYDRQKPLPLGGGDSWGVRYGGRHGDLFRVQRIIRS